MKGLKKFLTGILAGAMALSMTISAGSVTAKAETAAATKKITIKKEIKKGELASITYTPYQIMKATLSADGNSAAYYVESENVAEYLEGTGFFTKTKVTDTHFNIALSSKYDNSEATAKLIAAELKKDVESTTSHFTAGTTFTTTEDPATGTKDGDPITLVAETSVEPGYYLVLSSLGSVAAVQTIGDVSINEKNTYPTINKKQAINEGKATHAEYTKNTVSQEVGKKIYYSVEVTVPTDVIASDATISDTPSTGLTLNTDVEVYVNDVKSDEYSTANWSVFADADNDGKYTLTIPGSEVINNKGNKISFRYYATVNQDAITVDEVTNTVSIHYENYNSPDDFVKAKVYKFSLLKVEKGNDSKKLAGVKFTLQNPEGLYYSVDEDDKVSFVSAKTELTTPESGVLEFKGLNKGVAYTLTETSTLDGYNLLPNPITVTFDENGTAILAKDSVTDETFNTVDGDTLQLKIENGKGIKLPSTGGIGTTIFYIIGGLLIVAAVVFFVVRRKADAE